MDKDAAFEALFYGIRRLGVESTHELCVNETGCMRWTSIRIYVLIRITVLQPDRAAVWSCRGATCLSSRWLVKWLLIGAAGVPE